MLKNAARVSLRLLSLRVADRTRPFAGGTVHHDKLAGADQEALCVPALLQAEAE